MNCLYCENMADGSGIYTMLCKSCQNRWGSRIPVDNLVPVVLLELVEKEIDKVLEISCKGETNVANKRSYSVFATMLKGHFRMKAKGDGK